MAPGTRGRRAELVDNLTGQAPPHGRCRGDAEPNTPHRAKAPPTTPHDSSRPPPLHQIVVATTYVGNARALPPLCPVVCCAHHPRGAYRSSMLP